MPVRLCAETGCAEKAHYRGRCALHARAQERPSKFAHVYSTKRWRLLRGAIIVERPICEVCDNALATEVHHVIALEQGGEPYDPTGLQALCKSCHSKITQRERRFAAGA